MEELNRTLLIFVNLVLIEALGAIPPSWALGTFISKISKSDNNRPTIFVFVSFQLLKVILFLFIYSFFAGWKIMILMSLFISMIGFIPFKREIGKSILYILLFVMVFCILVMEQPFLEYHSSVIYPFNITTNWYLIGCSYVAGIVVFWYVLYWAVKESEANKLVRWGGYFMLGFFIL
jgi:hypothetical protein